MVASNTTNAPIDAYLLGRIEYRVNELIDRFHLPADRRDDLAQEMATNLIEAWGKFNRNIATWHTHANRVLDFAAKRLSTDVIRARKRATQYDSSTAIDALPDDDDRLSRCEQSTDITAMLDSLPKPQRDVFVLIMQGSTVAQVADQLGISRQAIYDRMTKARGRLRKSYKDWSLN